MSVSLKIGKHKSRKGGLTKAGVKKYNRETGSKLRTGVKGKPKTQSDYRRKGSYLRRFFANPSGPLVDKNGKPTRLSLSANAWGETPPKTRLAAAKLAAKGTRLLDRAKKMKEAKKKKAK